MKALVWTGPHQAEIRSTPDPTPKADEVVVRIRAADTQELERIRGAIDEGIERLCSVLEGQLDRVWAANDVELEHIRSAGADRLAEVHDLLTDQLERLRMERPSEPPPEPATRPRRWRRARSGASD